MRLSDILRTVANFEFGELLMTSGIDRRLAFDADFSSAVSSYIVRHLTCDWGDLDPEDKHINDEALKENDGRLMSSYNYDENCKVWIITEADRSATTILFPSEY